MDLVAAFLGFLPLTWAAELSCGGQRPFQATNTKIYKSTNKHSTNTIIGIINNLSSTDHHVEYSKYTGDDQLVIITPLQEIRATQTHLNYNYITIRQ